MTEFDLSLHRCREPPPAPTCRSSASATRCSRCRLRWPARCWRCTATATGRSTSAGGCCGSSSRWWRRAARRWGSTGWSTRATTRSTRGPPTRELPRGAMTRARGGRCSSSSSSAVFVFAAWQLGPLCFALSPVALAIVFWYSLAKRFTSYTQLFLGLAMAVAPVGGWLAAGGRGGWEPWLLGLAIGTWVGGFDVLYACQDLEFDRAHGLRSIPVRFGVARVAGDLARDARHHRRLPGGARRRRRPRAGLSGRRRRRRGAARVRAVARQRPRSVAGQARVRPERLRRHPLSRRRRRWRSMSR